jgi:hypothetical protein
MMNSRNLLLLIIFLLLAALAPACGPRNDVKDSLSRHQRLWVNQGIKNYQYRLRVNCFCPPEVTDQVIVEVRAGAASSVSYAASGKPAESKYFDKYDTMDELFLVIEDAIKRGAAEISVTYDETSGIPTRISIDFVKLAIDDEIAYDISNFQGLR